MLGGDRVTAEWKAEDEAKVSAAVKHEVHGKQDCPLWTQEISPYYRRDRFDNSTLPLPPPHVLRQLLDSPESRNIKRKKKHGPRGHPFQHVGRCTTDEGSTLDCSLTEPVIHDLLAQCIDFETRIEPQQERADAIRFELSLHGVRVNTSTLQWTTDPDYVFNETPPGNSSDSKNQHFPVYREEKGLSKLGSRTDRNTKTRQRIEHLIRRRLEAGMTGRRNEMIFIEWELQRCYGVHLDDENQTWFTEKRRKEEGSHEDSSLLRRLSSPQIDITCTCFPPLVFYQNTSIWNSPAYSKSSLSSDIDLAIAHRVCSLVQERIHKREESKYVEADAIRQELWHAYVRF
eukprot:scaffold1147_cov172-Amphora_coffeaeformis.AAC.21